MNALRSVHWLAGVCLLLATVPGAACDSGGSEGDAWDAPLDDAAGETPYDAPHETPADVTPADDGSPSDSPLPDGGPCATDARCPQPPAGYALCGGGALDADAMVLACQVVDPILDLHVGLEKDCAALTPVRGRYEVYCGAGEAYVWVLLEELTSTAVNGCTVTVPLPDGGTVTGDYFRLSWNLRDPNTQIYYQASVVPEAGGAPQNFGGMGPTLTYGYSEPDEPESPDLWRGRWGFDTRLNTSGSSGAASGEATGTVYVAITREDCDGPAGDGWSLVLAVPLEWTAP